MRNSLRCTPSEMDAIFVFWIFRSRGCNYQSIFAGLFLVVPGGCLLFLVVPCGSKFETMSSYGPCPPPPPDNPRPPKFQPELCNNQFL
jgi:hypothetical protein